MNQLLTVEVAEFVDAVDAALADLPAEVRAELLDDLPGHLGDVIAEGGSPRDELGEPAAYAAELRAAAGYGPASADTASRPRRDIRARLRAADERIGRAIGYQRLSELLRALQPAWWVLRGYLATLLIGGANGREGVDAFIPKIDGNWPLGVIVLLLLIGVSVLAGRRSRGRGNTVLAVSVMVAIVLSLYGVHVADHAMQNQYVYDDSSNEGGPLDNVSNIYPYGPDGKVLHNVRLYDQDGNPIDTNYQCSDENEPPAVPLYPRCPQDETAPDVVTPGGPIAPLPSAAVSAAPSTTTPTAPTTTPTAAPRQSPR